MGAKNRLRIVNVNEYSYLVTGTDDPHIARKLLPPEVDRWGGTEFGHWVRRGGRWQSRSTDWAPLPKDARNGVFFGGCLDVDGHPVNVVPWA